MRRSIDVVVEQALGSKNSLEIIENAFGEAPIHVREEVVDMACELYNDAIVNNYYSRVSDKEEKKMAQQEYAFRKAVTHAYQKLGWSDDKAL